MSLEEYTTDMKLATDGGYSLSSQVCNLRYRLTTPLTVHPLIIVLSPLSTQLDCPVNDLFGLRVGFLNLHSRQRLIT